jgi:hypothetical protein
MKEFSCRLILLMVGALSATGAVAQDGTEFASLHAAELGSNGVLTGGGGPAYSPDSALVDFIGQVHMSLAGAYKSSAQHPRVFMTQAELNDLATRINSPGSFSEQAFAKLTKQVKADLDADVDWDAAYAGCDLDIYLHSFSMEAAGGYSGEIRSQAQMSAALKAKPGKTAPAGAAVAAARMAVYAALVKAGAHAAPGSPAPDQAVAVSRRILLAWANRGFRDQQGHTLKKAEQFCDGKGRLDPNFQNGVALQVSRGVVYSVDAQDMLQSLAALSPAEVNALNSFHTALFELIVEASQFRFNLPELNHPDSVCELYSNHTGTALMGMISIARLLDDERRFNAVVFGGDRADHLPIPWTAYFDRAIYGEADKPIACYKNTGPDRATSKNSFQTPVVAPGEIEDRYRNANKDQAFGYTLGLLAELYNTAEMLRIAGFDAYGYRGSHHQSIEMATQYYSCFGKHAGLDGTVTADNARACPDYQQYVGQVLNGLDAVVLIGSYRFPKNTAITELESPAKTYMARYSVDVVRFGRWRE